MLYLSNYSYLASGGQDITFCVLWTLSAWSVADPGVGAKKMKTSFIIIVKNVRVFSVFIHSNKLLLYKIRMSMILQGLGNCFEQITPPPPLTKSWIRHWLFSMEWNLLTT